MNLWYKINNQPTPPLLPFTLYQNKHPILLTSQLAPSNPNSLTHSLPPTRFQIRNPLSLIPWSSTTHTLIATLITLRWFSRKISTEENKKKPFSLLTFSHFSTNRMARLHWTLVPSSSLLLLLLLLLLCLLPLLHASTGDSDPIYRQVSSFSLSNFPWFQ